MRHFYPAPFDPSVAQSQTLKLTTNSHCYSTPNAVTYNETLLSNLSKRKTSKIKAVSSASYAYEGQRQKAQILLDLSTNHGLKSHMNYPFFPCQTLSAATLTPYIFCASPLFSLRCEVHLCVFFFVPFFLNAFCHSLQKWHHGNHVSSSVCQSPPFNPPVNFKKAKKKI